MSLTDPTVFIEAPIFEGDTSRDGPSLRLACVEASVDYFKARGLGDPGEVMALAERMWTFVKGGVDVETMERRPGKSGPIAE